jgi:copper transport protein
MVELAAGDFGPLDPTDVEMELSRPNQGIQPIRIAVHADDAGLWRSGKFVLPMPGQSQLTLRVLINDFTRVSVSGPVTFAQ